MTKKNIGEKFLISGRVQGVFYRRFAKNVADQLKLTGWVCNLPDGRVEAQAFGSDIQLTALYTQLKKGPVAAKVQEVIVDEIAWEVWEGFQIK